MVTCCPYCDYAYPDRPVPQFLLDRLTEKGIPIEDYFYWAKKIALHSSMTEYRGVKVHIGRKHKGEDNWPIMRPNDYEMEILNRPPTYCL